MLLFFRVRTKLSRCICVEGVLCAPDNAKAEYMTLAHTSRSHPGKTRMIDMLA